MGDISEPAQVLRNTTSESPQRARRASTRTVDQARQLHRSATWQRAARRALHRPEQHLILSANPATTNQPATRPKDRAPQEPPIRRNAVAARDRIKTYQRRIAQLDAVYQRAQEHLDDQQHKRADLIATQDQLVSEAQRAVEEAIATMAGEIGSELTAHLVGADPREVRRMFKRTTAEATSATVTLRTALRRDRRTQPAGPSNRASSWLAKSRPWTLWHRRDVTSRAKPETAGPRCCTGKCGTGESESFRHGVEAAAQLERS